MNKQALAPIGILLTLSVAACSLVVNADRSKVKDNLYRPVPVDSMPAPPEPEPDAGDDAAAPEGGAAGAAGAAGEAGAGGATGGEAGAGGASAGAAGS